MISASKRRATIRTPKEEHLPFDYRSGVTMEAPYDKSAHCYDQAISPASLNVGLV